MLKMKLWLVALLVALSSPPAWALPSLGGASLGKQKSERNDSSIRLTAAKGAELSFLSQRLLEVLPALQKRAAASTNGWTEAKPRRDRARFGHNGWSRGEHWQAWRGHRSSATPTPQATPQSSGVEAVPIPEPSALMCFGVGIVMARGAVRRRSSR